MSGVHDSPKVDFYDRLDFAELAAIFGQFKNSHRAIVESEQEAGNPVPPEALAATEVPTTVNELAAEGNAFAERLGSEAAQQLVETTRETLGLNLRSEFPNTQASPRQSLTDAQPRLAALNKSMELPPELTNHLEAFQSGLSQVLQSPSNTLPQVQNALTSLRQLEQGLDASTLGRLAQTKTTQMRELLGQMRTSLQQLLHALRAGQMLRPLLIQLMYSPRWSRLRLRGQRANAALQGNAPDALDIEKISEAKATPGRKR